MEQLVHVIPVRDRRCQHPSPACLKAELQALRGDPLNRNLFDETIRTFIDPVTAEKHWSSGCLGIAGR